MGVLCRESSPVGVVDGNMAGVVELPPTGQAMAMHESDPAALVSNPGGHGEQDQAGSMEEFLYVLGKQSCTRSIVNTAATSREGLYNAIRGTLQ